MGMGIGKTYWVHVLKYCYGDLGQIISFMIKNDESTDKKWFEVRPVVDTKTGKLKGYQCNYVEMDGYEKTK